jgi:phosphoribosyl 1,2-cyclic phosphate phosphodiesterase
MRSEESIAGTGGLCKGARVFQHMAELTITFLGTGTSQGVPMIGCDCEVCRSTDSRDRRLRSSIFVQTPECAWVVDTGTDFREQCLREKIREIMAVVYTHSHTDHIMGFDDLRQFCVNGKTLPIYASPETMDDLKRVFNFAFNGLNLFPGYVRPDPRLIEGPFLLGATELTPLPVKHGRAKVNGYLFSRNGESLAAYLSDCKEVPDAVAELIVGTKVLIIDALRYESHPTHMNFDEALTFAEKMRPQQTWFTHLSHDIFHEKAERELPANVRIAYDGLKLTV